MLKTLLSKSRHRWSACWEQPHCRSVPLTNITWKTGQGSLNNRRTLTDVTQNWALRRNLLFVGSGGRSAVSRRSATKQARTNSRCRGAFCTRPAVVRRPPKRPKGGEGGKNLTERLSGAECCRRSPLAPLAVVTAHTRVFHNNRRTLTDVTQN